MAHVYCLKPVTSYRSTLQISLILSRFTITGTGNCNQTYPAPEYPPAKNSKALFCTLPSFNSPPNVRYRSRSDSFRSMASFLDPKSLSEFAYYPFSPTTELSWVKTTSRTRN